MIQAPKSVESLPSSVRQEVIETTREFLRSQRTQSAQPPEQSEQASRTQRKSVSFDLTDNEYIPVFEAPPDAHQTSTAENIGDLFLSQFKHGSDSANDGYEVPIKYPAGSRRRLPSQPVKGILRSPSPNSGILLSSDRPLRTSREHSFESQVEASRAHASDDEIEHDNPFRADAMRHSYENIYEELRFSDQSSRPVSSESDTNDAMSGYARPQKLKPKLQAPDSAGVESSEKSIAVNPEMSDEERQPPIVSRPTTGRSERPKNKPPIPPKPQISKTIKQAKLVKNDALEVLQSEMNKGDFYEYRHDPETNRIIRIEQPAEVFVEDSDSSSPDEKESKQMPAPVEKTSAAKPIPPPSTSQKVYRRTCSAERPSVSPPPPPVNLATLPVAAESQRYRTESGQISEILAPSAGSRTEIDSITSKLRAAHHENSPEYSLVTESTYREILLHENDLRNAIQQQSSDGPGPVSRLPIRRAPAPPPAAPHSDPAEPKYELHQLHPPKPVSQIFPETKILPVQYSHLPTPQQPGYFHAHPPTQLNLCCAVSHPSANCVLSPNLIPPPHYHHFHTFHHPMTDTHSSQPAVFYPNSPVAFRAENYCRPVGVAQYAHSSNSDGNNQLRSPAMVLHSVYGEEKTRTNNNPNNVDKSNESILKSLESETSMVSSLVLDDAGGEHDAQATIVFETTEIENVTCKTVLTTFGKQTSV